MSKVKLGDNLWYVKDKSVIPFRVDFLNKEYALMEVDEDITVKVKQDELYSSKEEAELAIKNIEHIIVCREVSNYNAEVCVRKLDGKVTSELLTFLNLRSRLNPELTYFATTQKVLDEYEEVFKNNPNILVESAFAVQI